MEIIMQVMIALISLIGSFIISMYVSRHEFERLNENKAFENFYNAFWVLRDSIHQGRAIDFSDLSCENQDKIIELLINTYSYQSKEVRNLVYILKTCRLNNFGGKSNIEVCNNTYNELTEVICNKYLEILSKSKKTQMVNNEKVYQFCYI